MNTLAKRQEFETNQSGSLQAGFLFASFKNVGDSPATVGGVPLMPGKAKGYPFIGKGYEEPLAYNPDGSTLRILNIF